MRKQHLWITIVLVLCACSTTPSAPAASSAIAATPSSAASAITSAPAPADAASSPTGSSATASPATSNSATTVVVSGSVWRDVCDSGSEAQPPPTTPPPGCVAGAAGGFIADGTRAAEEPPIARVRVTLATGACPAVPTSTTETDGEGRWTFPNLAPGTYCVAVASLDEANLPLLLPGTWTAPADALGSSAASTTVMLGATEQRTDINFGWDYQLQP